jgi:integrase/recombinase XerD
MKNKQLPVVKIGQLIHKQQEWYALYFKHNIEINKLIKSVLKSTFSASNKCWLVPVEKNTYLTLINVFKNVATLDTSLLVKYKSDKEKKISIKLNSTKNTLTKNELENTSINLPQQIAIHQNNKSVLNIVQQQLQLKAYSLSTRKTYLNELAIFLATIKNQKASELTAKRVKDYLEYCSKELKLSENSMHSRINALKFYYEQVLGKDKFFYEIPRAKKPYKLPNVLSEKEIVKLFSVLENAKHKAILFIAYSAGLRVSEVVGLKIINIDSDRMQIKIEEAKGKKDRYVNLSKIVLDVLRAYIKQCSPTPQKVFLFESTIAGEPYSSRSAQKSISKSKRKKQE